MQKQVYLKITGRVQGVFFRAQTQEKAQELGIKGWVKNTEDGGVEIMAQGKGAALENFISWCKKGPDSSNVKKIQIDWHSGKIEKYAGFIVRY